MTSHRVITDNPRGVATALFVVLDNVVDSAEVEAEDGCVIDVPGFDSEQKALVIEFNGERTLSDLLEDFYENQENLDHIKRIKLYENGSEIANISFSNRAGAIRLDLSDSVLGPDEILESLQSFSRSFGEDLKLTLIPEKPLPGWQNGHGYTTFSSGELMIDMENRTEFLPLRDIKSCKDAGEKTVRLKINIWSRIGYLLRNLIRYRRMDAGIKSLNFHTESQKELFLQFVDYFECTYYGGESRKVWDLSEHVN